MSGCGAMRTAAIRLPCNTEFADIVQMRPIWSQHDLIYICVCLETARDIPPAELAHARTVLLVMLVHSPMKLSLL